MIGKAGSLNQLCSPNQLDGTMRTCVCCVWWWMYAGRRGMGVENCFLPFTSIHLPGSCVALGVNGFSIRVSCNWPFGVAR